jgi:Ni/Co efflux regulator RcnB
MNKLFAAIVASTFALGSVSGFAADAAKQEPLTQEQRTDMRNRADQLTKERTAGSTQVKANLQHAPKAAAHHARKGKKVSPHNVK